MRADTDTRQSYLPGAAWSQVRQVPGDRLEPSRVRGEAGRRPFPLGACSVNSPRIKPPVLCRDAPQLHFPRSASVGVYTAVTFSWRVRASGQPTVCFPFFLLHLDENCRMLSGGQRGGPTRNTGLGNFEVSVWFVVSVKGSFT